jgi:hypothetical protein
VHSNTILPQEKGHFFTEEGGERIYKAAKLGAF